MMGNIAFDALRDLRFRSMIIRLDGYLAGEFATRLTIDGVALGNTSTQRLIRVDQPHPVQVQRLDPRPFRALIATAKSFRDPRQHDRRPRFRARSMTCPGSSPKSRRREEEQQQTQTPVKRRDHPDPQPTEQ